MNRRSFFGLFGGAAVVPFLPLPEPVKPFLDAAQAAEAEAEFKHAQYGVAFMENGNVVGHIGPPKVVWPGINAMFGEVYGPRDDGSEWES